MSSPGELHPDEGMISAFLDGEASPEERARVEEHLRTCQRCREIADDFRSLAATAASEEPPPVPADLSARIGAQVGADAERRTPHPRPAWRNPFALAAAGVAVATLVWIAMGRQGAWRVAPAPVPPSAQKPAPSLRAPAAGSEAGPIVPASPPAAQESTGRGGEKQSPAPIQRGTAEIETESPGQPGSSPPRADRSRAAGEDSSIALGKKGEVLPEPEGSAAVGLKDAGAVGGVAAGVASSSPPEAVPRKARGGGPRIDTSGGAGGDQPAGSARQRPKRSTGQGAAAQLSLESALESPASGSAVGPRTLALETPATTLTISEDGSVTLVRRGYACSANVASPAAPGERPSLPPEVVTLFARATSREVTAAVAKIEPAGALTPEQEEARPRSITLSNAEGGTLYAVSFGEAPEAIPPLAVLDLEADIKAVTWLHLRKTLEERCGPVPGVPPGTIP